jgi:hypothetical protein
VSFFNGFGKGNVFLLSRGIPFARNKTARRFAVGDGSLRTSRFHFVIDFSRAFLQKRNLSSTATDVTPPSIALLLFTVVSPVETGACF